MLGEELLSAIRLLKTGLRELNRMNGAIDFFHLPLLLLSSGFERLMKVVICCHHLRTTNAFPGRREFSKKPQAKHPTPTHDLTWLLDKIVRTCFSDEYLSQVPAAMADIEFLRTDVRLRRIIDIMSQFAQSARYYNLNVVFDDPEPGPSPDDEWQKLEMEVLQDDPMWMKHIADPKQTNAIHLLINRKLTVHCERLARSLSRLFTIGGLGQLAKQISPHAHHFLSLMDDDLGVVDYESVRI